MYWIYFNNAYVFDMFYIYGNKNLKKINQGKFLS
jgi:hypothetical protein